MALLIYLNDLFMLPFIPQWCYCYQEDYKLLFPIENKSHLKTQKEMKQKKKKKKEMRQNICLVSYVGYYYNL